jgi:hypothetical protein
MMKIISFVTILVFALSMFTACVQPTPAPVVTPTPGSDPATTPAPTDAADNGELTVTLDDQGKTISLMVGQTFLLKLGEDNTWDITVGNEEVIYRVRNIAVIRGAQGMYSANTPGQTTLTATGDPLCRQSKPACAKPSIQFSVTLVVKG